MAGRSASETPAGEIIRQFGYKRARGFVGSGTKVLATPLRE